MFVRFPLPHADDLHITCNPYLQKLTVPAAVQPLIWLALGIVALVRLKIGMLQP